MAPRSTRLVRIAACAGSTCARAAAAEDPILTDMPMKANITGYVYINARTGERVVSPYPSAARSDTVPRFVNEDYVGNGEYWFSIDNPAASFPASVGGGVRLGGECASWGDIAFDTIIDSVRIAACTMAVSPIDPDWGPIPGLDVTVWFYDCDDGRNDDDAIPVTGITATDMNSGVSPTLPDAITVWFYTIDLAGSGLEFELGDTDGSYIGLSGQSSTGCDKDDTDGNPLADFGWSYAIQQNQSGPPAHTGPAIVLPINQGEEGVENWFDMYKNPTGGRRELHAGTYRFSASGTPYASFYLGLYGPSGPDCSPADYNGDTSIDVLDFLDFIDDFGSCANQPAPCGTIGDADRTGDTVVDTLDFLEFFDFFGQCS